MTPPDSSSPPDLSWKDLCLRELERGSPDQTIVLSITMLSDQLELSLPLTGLQFLTSSVLLIIPNLQDLC